MLTVTTAQLAGQLRKLADTIDTDTDLRLSVYVTITPTYTAAQNARVAAVDAVAELLGLTARPVKSAASWYHEASDVRDGVDVRAYTHIKAPAQRCACGAECTHTSEAGTR